MKKESLNIGQTYKIKNPVTDSEGALYSGELVQLLEIIDSTMIFDSIVLDELGKRHLISSSNLDQLKD